MSGYFGVLTASCPFCGYGIFFTDNPEEHAQHHQEFEKSDLVLVASVDGGGWKPSVEIQVRGRVGRLTRDDIPSVAIYPMQCPACKKVLVAHLGVTNRERVEHYENNVRPYHPPLKQGDEVLPAWAIVGYTPRDFVAEVNNIKNPMIRGGLVRRLDASPFRFDGLQREDRQLPPPRRSALPG